MEQTLERNGPHRPSKWLACHARDKTELVE